MGFPKRLKGVEVLKFAVGWAFFLLRKLLDPTGLHGQPPPNFGSSCKVSNERHQCDWSLYQHLEATDSQLQKHTQDTLQHNCEIPLLRRSQTSPRCHSCPSQEPFSCRGVLVDGMGLIPGAHLTTTSYSGSAHQTATLLKHCSRATPPPERSCHQLHVPWTMMNHLVGLERPSPSMNEIQAAPLNLAGVCTVCTQAPYLASRRRRYLRSNLRNKWRLRHVKSIKFSGSILPKIKGTKRKRRKQPVLKLLFSHNIATP